jgi:hypothetical protein
MKFLLELDTTKRVSDYRYMFINQQLDITINYLRAMILADAKYERDQIILARLYKNERVTMCSRDLLK